MCDADVLIVAVVVLSSALAAVLVRLWNQPQPSAPTTEAFTLNNLHEMQAALACDTDSDDSASYTGTDELSIEANLLSNTAHNSQ